MVKKNSVGTSTQSGTTVVTEEPEILLHTTSSTTPFPGDAQGSSALRLPRSPETFEATTETTRVRPLPHLAVKQPSDDERLWPEGTSHEKIASGGSGDVYKVTFD